MRTCIEIFKAIDREAKEQIRVQKQEEFNRAMNQLYYGQYLRLTLDQHKGILGNLGNSSKQRLA